MKPRARRGCAQAAGGQSQRRGEVAHRRCRRFAHNTDAATGLWVSPSCEAPTNSATRAASERTHKAKTACGRRGQTQRREANALTSHRAPRNVRASLGGDNGHVSCEGRSGNRNIVRVGGDSSKLHPEITATPRTGAGWRGRPHADTLARWRRLAQSGVAAHKPRALAGTPPSPHSSLTPSATPKRST